MMLLRPAISIDSDFSRWIRPGPISTPAGASRAVRSQFENELSQLGFSRLGLALVRHGGPRCVKGLLKDDQGLGIVLSHGRISIPLLPQTDHGCRSTTVHCSKSNAGFCNQGLGACRLAAASPRAPTVRQEN